MAALRRIDNITLNKTTTKLEKDEESGAKESRITFNEISTNKQRPRRLIKSTNDDKYNESLSESTTFLDLFKDDNDDDDDYKENQPLNDQNLTNSNSDNIQHPSPIKLSSDKPTIVVTSPIVISSVSNSNKSSIQITRIVKPKPVQLPTILQTEQPLLKVNIKPNTRSSTKESKPTEQKSSQQSKISDEDIDQPPIKKLRAKRNPIDSKTSKTNKEHHNDDINNNNNSNKKNNSNNQHTKFHIFEESSESDQEHVLESDADNEWSSMTSHKKKSKSKPKNVAVKDEYDFVVHETKPKRKPKTNESKLKSIEELINESMASTTKTTTNKTSCLDSSTTKQNDESKLSSKSYSGTSGVGLGVGGRRRMTKKQLEKLRREQEEQEKLELDMKNWAKEMQDIKNYKLIVETVLDREDDL